MLGNQALSMHKQNEAMPYDTSQICFSFTKVIKNRLENIHRSLSQEKIFT